MVTTRYQLPSLGETEARSCSNVTSVFFKVEETHLYVPGKSPCGRDMIVSAEKNLNARNSDTFPSSFSDLNATRAMKDATKKE